MNFSVVAGIFAVFFLWYLASPFSHDYRLTDSSIEIVLFRQIPVRRISMRDIAEVRVVSWKETTPFSQPLSMYFAERWGNRLWGPMVLIRKKKGLSRRLIITPKDPQAFIRLIEERMKALETV